MSENQASQDLHQLLKDQCQQQVTTLQNQADKWEQLSLLSQQHARSTSKAIASKPAISWEAAKILNTCSNSSHHKGLREIRNCQKWISHQAKMTTINKFSNNRKRKKQESSTEKCEHLFLNMKRKSQRREALLAVMITKLIILDWRKMCRKCWCLNLFNWNWSLNIEQNLRGNKLWLKDFTLKKSMRPRKKLLGKLWELKGFRIK